MVRDVSSAILVTTEGEEMAKIQKTWFDNQATCSSEIRQLSSSRLSLKNFAGLFYITGAVSLSALLLFIFNFFYNSWGMVVPDETENSVFRRAASKVAAFAKHFDMKDLSCNRRSEQPAGNVSSREESQRGDLEQGISSRGNSQTTHG